MRLSNSPFGFSGSCVLRDGKSGDGTTTESQTNQQVATQGGSGFTNAVGSGGSSNERGVTSRGGGIGSASGHGTAITTINSSDPQVTEAALAANENVAGNALASNATVATSALNDLESTATTSIEAGVYDTQLNDQFGESALQMAANSEANSTTALEAMGTETQQNAANALAAAQNEITAGVAPSQQFQDVTPTTPGTLAFGDSTLSTWAMWLGIAAAVIGIFYYLGQGKKK